MKILLHICCGPCLIYPLTVLRSEDHEVYGFFFNPNIHPYREFRKRISALEKVAGVFNLSLECIKEYGLKDYMRKVVFNEERRCSLCYLMRLEETVRKAKYINADAFTTTLLYSRYQNHDLIQTICKQLAHDHGISFYYRDFREGWRQGIDMSVKLGVYRQPYCGCIYSEQERYDSKARKQRKKEIVVIPSEQMA